MSKFFSSDVANRAGGAIFGAVADFGIANYGGAYIPNAGTPWPMAPFPTVRKWILIAGSATPLLIPKVPVLKKIPVKKTVHDISVGALCYAVGAAVHETVLNLIPYAQ